MKEIDIDALETKRVMTFGSEGKARLILRNKVEDSEGLDQMPEPDVADIRAELKSLGDEQRGTSGDHGKPENETKVSKKNNSKDIARFLRRHFLAKAAGNMFVLSALAYYLIFTRDGWQTLRNPELRQSLFNREENTGLLEDSIFAPDLYFPSDEGTGLENRRAVAGRWVAYDFNRPNEFGSIVKKRKTQVKQGKILAFPLIDIIDNKPDKYTPTNLFHSLWIEHLLQMESPTISDLIDYGLVEETTYREAYSRANLYDKYRVPLTLARLNDQTVYGVTPKGNGLIFLNPDFGDKKEHKEPKKILKPVFNF